MELPTYFSDFLQDIRLTDSQVSDAKTGHETLRDRLHEYDDFGPLIVNTILQGSYRRATAVRPYGEKRADVDVIVVTKLSSEEYAPDDIVPIFIPFLDEYYKGKWELQGRSFGISLSYIDLDMVITAAPSESEIGIYESEDLGNESALDEDLVLMASLVKKAEEWKESPLLIPNRDLKKWDETHPVEQIRWTQEKNKNCNSHYVNVVKALKWWRRVHCTTPKYPKGYPVEHVIGFCCPNNINSVAEGVALTLEDIAIRFADYAKNETIPFLPDHGVPSHNVLGRVDGKDFAAFHKQCTDAARIARTALDESSKKKSAEEWRKLFGNKFPEAPDDGSGNIKKGDGPSGGFTPRGKPGEVEGGRFA